MRGHLEEDKAVRVMVEMAHPSFLQWRQDIEYGLAALLTAYRFFVKRKLTPVEVHFTHQFDGDTDEHHRIFGCPVKFGRSRNEIILNRKDLAAPIETADDRLLRILTSYCELILKRRASRKPELIARLERCIVALMPKGRAKVRLVATGPGMSERTLARRLGEMGTSFSEVLDQLRQELALKYLRQPELSLTQVAFLLGYSNLSAFSTAFKRTTGHTRPGK